MVPDDGAIFESQEIDSILNPGQIDIEIVKEEIEMEGKY